MQEEKKNKNADGRRAAAASQFLSSSSPLPNARLLGRDRLGRGARLHVSATANCAADRPRPAARHGHGRRAAQAQLADAALTRHARPHARDVGELGVRPALAVKGVAVGVGDRALDVALGDRDVDDQGGQQDGGVDVKVPVVVAVERVVGDPAAVAVAAGGRGDDEVEGGGEVGAAVWWLLWGLRAGGGGGGGG